MTTPDIAAERPAWPPALPFKPWRMVASPGRPRQIALTWLVVLLVAAPTAVLTRWYGWSGVPVDVAGTQIHLTLYLPMLACVPLTLWYGWLWGAIPAWCSTCLVAISGGMPPAWIPLFALANPLGLAIYAAVYRVTQLRTDLRNVQSIVGYVVVSLLAALAGSAGSFIWAHTNSVGMVAAYPIWQGWWLGGWLQATVVVGPALFVLGPRVEAWLAPVKAQQVPRGHWRNQLLLAIGGALAVLVGYAVVARMFSMAQLQRALANGADSSLASAVDNAVDGLSYPLYILAATMVAGGYFAWLAVNHWQQALVRANATLAERNAELTRIATTDVLTGVATRRRIMEDLDQAFERCHRERRPLTVVMVDADHFKQVNDTWGHLAGDAVLQAIAGTMQAQLRSYDLLGRYGGEEFLVLLPDTDQATALQIATRLCQQVAATPVTSPDGAVIKVTVSLGMAQLGPADSSAQVLVDRADKALLQAKEQGRNRVVVA